MELVAALLAFLLLGLVASSALISYQLARRYWSGQALIPYQPHLAMPWKGGQILLLVGFLILSMLSMAGLAHGALSGDELTKVLVGFLVDSASKLLTMLFAILLVRGMLHTWSLPGFETTHWTADVKLGALGFVAAAFPVYGINAFASWALQKVGLLKPDAEHPILQILDKDASAALVVMAMFAACIVAPLFEEFFFRGVLQGWLERRTGMHSPRYALAVEGESPHDVTGYEPHEIAELQSEITAGGEPSAEQALANPYKPPLVEHLGPETSADSPVMLGGIEAHDEKPRMMPIVLTSLLFAALHYGHGAAPIALFFLSLVLGYLFQRTGRLWPSITLHACLNTFSMAAYWMNRFVDLPDL